MTSAPVAVEPRTSVAVVVDEGQHAVGIVSLGDLAIERDPESALGDIGSTRPNK
ncbi:hypothetical protein OG272_06545 [Streptomyces sp. NBC_00104]|uniref:hypothetical protein n=1 Tax=Streptomyces sp. NBC_00104 TaxID=2903621 RepID=UPI0032563FCA